MTEKCTFIISQLWKSEVQKWCNQVLCLGSHKATIQVLVRLHFFLDSRVFSQAHKVVAVFISLWLYFWEPHSFAHCQPGATHLLEATYSPLPMAFPRLFHNVEAHFFKASKRVSTLLKQSLIKCNIIMDVHLLPSPLHTTAIRARELLKRMGFIGSHTYRVSVTVGFGRSQLPYEVKLIWSEVTFPVPLLLPLVLCLQRRHHPRLLLQVSPTSPLSSTRDLALLPKGLAEMRVPMMDLSTFLRVWELLHFKNRWRKLGMKL